MNLRIGSRGSQLALWQANHIAALLRDRGHSVEIEIIKTTGDRLQEVTFAQVGSKGMFTKEIEEALADGRVDLAVHSLKDLPVESAPGLCIGAVSPRADARDVLISANQQNLETLPLGARVGTSSLRREAQLKAIRPDLTILPLRGNVDTRIRKAMQGEYDAIILAAAGVERLDLAQYITEYLPFEVLLPAPGQGALAIQCRADDVELQALLAPVHDAQTYRAVTAERAFLSGLGGGCSAPVAAFAQASVTSVELQGLVASTDGQQVIRVNGNGEDPSEVGRELAQQAIKQGAGALLP